MPPSTHTGNVCKASLTEGTGSPILTSAADCVRKNGLDLHVCPCIFGWIMRGAWDALHSQLLVRSL
eukprot:5178420-Amphidinium_carterae.2